jgi:hypothetical protein
LITINIFLFFRKVQLFFVKLAFGSVGSLDPGFLSLGKISGLAGEWVGRIEEERWVGEEGSWSEIHVKLVLKLLIVKKKPEVGEEGRFTGEWEEGRFAGDGVGEKEWVWGFKGLCERISTIERFCWSWCN